MEAPLAAAAAAPVARTEKVLKPADGVEAFTAKDLQQAAITAAEVDGFKEQDRLLPIANIARIMKKCLPNETKVSKEAKECVQECTSEFISFITSEAAERCAEEKRKTITGDDLLFAMKTLGFENYADVLNIYLTKYREILRASGKRSATPWKRHKPNLATAGEEEEDLEGDDEDDEEGDFDDEGMEEDEDPANRS